MSAGVAPRLAGEVAVNPAGRWALEELALLEAKGLRRELEPLSSPQAAVVRIGDEELINFSSNDYLGLANDPLLVDAAIDAMRRHGMGAGASRLLVGDTLAHRELEARLARFEGAESALLFNSGYAANLGIISALVGRDDVVFSDALNHASLVDGCRLSRAKTFVYPHNDLAALRTLLKSTQGRRRLVCTDSVFSMDGDLAPLGDLVELCEAHQAALLVDEAHATGVLGPRGAGLCEALGVSARVDVRMGTLGKAVGVHGAYAATSKPVADLLLNRARSLVFSTALPAALCAAASAAVERVERGEDLRERLWRNIQRFSDGVTEMGLSAQPRSAIFTVMMGTPKRAVDASAALRARGVLVKPIRPPTVPEGTSRLRIALSAAHTEAHIDRVLSALAEVVRA